jgi:hypothetical protein
MGLVASRTLGSASVPGSIIAMVSSTRHRARPGVLAT